MVGSIELAVPQDVNQCTYVTSIRDGTSTPELLVAELEWTVNKAKLLYFRKQTSKIGNAAETKHCVYFVPLHVLPENRYRCEEHRTNVDQE